MTRTLVTGAGGFIGSHLVEACCARGDDVTAFVHYNARHDLGWLTDSPLLSSLRVVRGDVRDYDAVQRAVRSQDRVFHLAALIGIPYSYESPLAYIRTNVEGPYHILEAARTLGIARTLVSSTSETYGSAQYVPIDERHPLVGQSPYSASKIAADQLAVSYFRSFELPVALVRPFHTYGPRQSTRAVIPTIISQLLRGERTLRLGSTTPTRDLTFVTDTVEGFLAIADSDDCLGVATNIGMGEETSVGDLAQLIARLIGVQAEIVSDAERVRPSASEVDRLLADNSRVRRLTDWAPKYTLESGLRETIGWFERNLDQYRVSQYAV